MGFLDLFKPKWRHSDAQVRAEAVKQIGAEDSGLLARIVRQDSDARVRRIALKKIADVELLGEIAKSDPDEALRNDASEKASELLFTAAVADGDEARCRAALERIASERVIAKVARLAPFVSVQRAALDRLTEQKALAEVAHKAPNPQLRLLAVARLTDVGALRDVAIGDAFKEVALAALAKIDDDAALTAVDKKTKIKAVRAAARAKLDALRQAHPTEGVVGPSTEKRRRARQAQLCRIVETAAGAEDWDRAQSELEAAEAEWATLPAAEEAFQRRFDRALERWKARTSELQRKLRERAESQTRRAESEANREGAERAEAQARAAGEAGEAQAREAAGVEAAADRARRDEEQAAERARKEVERVGREADQAVERERREAETRHNLERLEQVSARLESLAGTDDRKAAEKALKNAHDVVQAAGMLPREKMVEAKARFQAARDKLHIRVQELRDADEWRRWSNLPRLEALCVKMEELAAAAGPDPAAPAAVGETPATEQPSATEQPVATARVVDLKQVSAELRALQAEWKAVGGASKDRSEKLSLRFRAASDQVYERCKTHFASLDEERAQSLAGLEALCVRVEALAGSTDWKKAGDDIKAAQAEWKELGPAPKDRAEAIWQRFRGACDQFFDRRKVHFDALDSERAGNWKRHEALCVRVEALAGSTDWKKAGDDIKAAQAEWKEVGPSPKDKADAIWQRFRGACDQFFDRRKAHFDELDAERAGNLKAKEALCLLAEELADAEDRAVSAEKVKQLEAQWKELGPAPRDDADAVWERFRAACDVALADKRTGKPAKATGSTGAAAAEEAPRWKNATLADKLSPELAQKLGAPAPADAKKPKPAAVEQPKAEEKSKAQEVDAGWAELAEDPKPGDKE